MLCMYVMYVCMYLLSAPQQTAIVTNQGGALETLTTRRHASHERQHQYIPKVRSHLYLFNKNKTSVCCLACIFAFVYVVAQNATHVNRISK